MEVGSSPCCPFCRGEITTLSLFKRIFGLIGSQRLAKQKGTARSAVGLGLRNRAERLSEYADRRAAVLGYGNGLGSVAADISIGIRFGLGPARKKRRVPHGAATFSEEDDGHDAGKMDVHTVVFGLGPDGDVQAG